MGNEHVDKMCTKLMDEEDQTDQPKFTSRAVAIACLKSTIHTVWRAKLKHFTYRGRSSLLKQGDIDKIMHSYSSHLILRTEGNSNKHYAQLTSFLSSHFPSGGFRRDREWLEGLITCPCTDDPRYREVESQHHVLYDCPFWIKEDLPGFVEQWDLPDQDLVNRYHTEKNKWHRKQPNKFSTVALELRDAQQKAGWQDIAKFLDHNPLCGTIEWQELCRLAEKAIAARDEGSSHCMTPACCFRRVLTDRPRAFEWWKRVTNEKYLWVGPDKDHQLYNFARFHR